MKQTGKVYREKSLSLDGKHFETRLASLKRVAAFVSESSHHLADGREPLRLQQLLLGRL